MKKTKKTANEILKEGDDKMQACINEFEKKYGLHVLELKYEAGYGFVWTFGFEMGRATYDNRK